MPRPWSASDADLRLGLQDAVLTITMDRPRARNALDRRTRVALVECLVRADDDPRVRVVVLTGADPAFTSGVDAKELLGASNYAPPAIDPPSCIRGMRTPTIAAVNGACVSGGLEIALACSFIIASARASFADTHVGLGLTPGWGLSADLPAAIGVSRARQMSLTGEFVDAQTALAWGLVNEVVSGEELLERVRALAARIARMPEHAAANALALYARGSERSRESARRDERAVLAGWRVDRGAALGRFDDAMRIEDRAVGQ